MQWTPHHPVASTPTMRDNPLYDGGNGMVEAPFTTFNMDDAPPPVARLSMMERGRTAKKEKEKFRWNRFSFWLVTPIATLLIFSAIILLVTVAELNLHALEKNWKVIHSGYVGFFNGAISISTLPFVETALVASVLEGRRIAANYEDPKEISYGCNILDRVDTKGLFKQVIKCSYREAKISYSLHNDNADPTGLAALQSRDSVVMDHYYYVNKTTYQYEEPPRVLRKYEVENLNLTSIIYTYFGNFFDDYENYVAQDKRPEYPAYKCWNANALEVSHIMVPFVSFSNQSEYDQRHPTHLRYITLRGLLSDPFETLPPLSRNTTTFRVMIISPVTINDKDPILIYNNWGQTMPQNTQFTELLDLSSLDHIRTNNITDPLMKAAVKHVKLDQLRDRNDYTTHTKTFNYRSNIAAVSWYRFLSERSGYEAIVVVATERYSTTGRFYAKVGGVIAGTCVAVVVLIVALVVLFEKEFTVPVLRMTRALKKSGDWRRGRNYRVKAACVVIRENYALQCVYNHAMEQVSEVEKFIPEAQRLKWENSSDSHSTFAESTQPQSSMDHSVAPARQQMQKVFSTAVYVRYATIDTSDPRAGRKVKGDLDHNPEALIGKRKENGLTPENLTVFFKVLLDEASKRRGVSLYISPDDCVFHFGVRVVGGEVKESGDRETGALDAVHFALAVARRLRRRNSSIYLQIVVDSTMFLQGTLNLTKSTRRYMVYGRDPVHDFAEVVEDYKRSVVLLTEETRLMVDEVVQLWPTEAAQGSRYCVVFYEAVGDLPPSPLWRVVCTRMGIGFAFMVIGHYENAIGELWKVKETVDDFLENDVATESGTMSSAEAGRLPSMFLKQVDFFIDVCVQRMVMGDRTRFVRVPLPLHYRYLMARGCQDAVDEEASSTYEDPAALFSASSVSAMPNFTDPDASSTRVDFSRYVYRSVLPITDSGEAVYAARPVQRIATKGGTFAINNRSCKSLQKPLFRQRYDIMNHVGETCSLVVYGLRFKIEDVLAYFGEQTNALLSPDDRGPVETLLMKSAPPGAYVVEVAEETQQPAAPSSWETVRRDIKRIVPLSLNSDNLIGVREVFCDFHRGCCFVTDGYAGGNLKEVREKFGTLSVKLIRRYVTCILKGLIDLHESYGMVHGLLEPRHVLVGVYGHCKLKGLFTDPQRARELFLLTETYYVSPEEVAGEPLTAASDMYCLGLMLLEMLTDAPPWVWGPEENRSEEQRRKVLETAGPPLRDWIARGVLVLAPIHDTDPDLTEVLRHCLHADADQRWTALKAYEFLSDS